METVEKARGDLESGQTNFKMRKCWSFLEKADKGNFAPGDEMIY